MSKNALLIFIKNPIKGTVKTRLAKTVGDEKALAIYHQLLAHTRQVTEKVNCDKFLFYSKFIEEDDWSATTYHKRKQITGDLGQKMSQAFQEIFEQGYERIAIIGSDCKELQTKHLEMAFEYLTTTDVVIGPTFDGGYYLLGMNKLYPNLFVNKEWSTDTVFPDTLQDIRLLGKNYNLLPKLSDVDYYEDWERISSKSVT